MSAPGEMSPSGRDDGLRTRFLGVIVVLLAIGALKVSAPVTMPLAFALFLIILAWPLQHHLERQLPRWAAFTLTVLAILLVAAVFVGALAYSAETIADKAPQYNEQLRAMGNQAIAWAEARHIPLPEDLKSRFGASSLSTLRGVVSGFVDFLGGVVVVAALLLLGLLEVRAYKRKLEARFDGTINERLIDIAESVAMQFRRFIGVRTLTSFMTATLTGLYCWVAGLDFAFVWALSAFFLNYIPTLGSVVSVGLIAVFAGLQFQSWLWAIGTAMVLGAIEITIGSFVDPRLQGRYLSISPFIVLLSIIFWGWLWGIPGALIAVPLTVALVAGVREFEGARWVADLLTEADPPEPEERKD